MLNTVTAVLMVLAFVAIAALALRAPRPPAVAELAFLTVAAFLLLNKVWSPQYSLWLVRSRCSPCRAGGSCWRG